MRRLVLGALMILSLPCAGQDAYRPAPYVKLANELLNSSGKKLAEKHQMHLIGTGGCMFKRVNSLHLSFQKLEPMDTAAARQLIVSCTEQFVAAINADDAIHPYLVPRTFTVENVEVRIFLSNEDGSDIAFPGIFAVECSGGNIYYYHRDSGGNPSHSETTESFEDALKLLDSEVSQKRNPNA